MAARKATSTCHECGPRGHWTGDVGCSGARDTTNTTWSDEHVLPDREDLRAIMTVQRIGQSDVSPFFPRLRGRSVCKASVINLQQFPDDARTKQPQQLSTSTHLPPLPLSLLCFSAESRKFGCTEGRELEPHGTVLPVFSAG